MKRNVVVAAVVGMAATLVCYFGVAGLIPNKPWPSSAEFPIGGLLPRPRTLWWFFGGLLSGQVGAVGYSLTLHARSRRQELPVPVWGHAVAKVGFLVRGGFGGLVYHEAFVRGTPAPSNASSAPAVTAAESKARLTKYAKAQQMRERMSEVRLLLETVEPGEIAQVIRRAETLDAYETARGLNALLVPRIDVIGWSRLTAEDRAFLVNYSDERVRTPAYTGGRRVSDPARAEHFRSEVLARFHGVADVAGALAACDEIWATRSGARERCGMSVAVLASQTCRTEAECRAAGYRGTLSDMAAQLGRDAEWMCTRTVQARGALCVEVLARLPVADQGNP